MAKPRIRWVIFLGLVVILPLPLENFAPALFGRTILIGIFTILILGFDLAVGYGGQINLGFQGFFAVGAYTTALLTTKDWVPGVLSEPLVAMLVGCLVAVAICYIISKPVLRTGGFFLGMVTLAFGMIVHSLAMGWDFLGGAYGIVGIPRFHIGSFSFTSNFQYYYLVWAFCTLLIFLSLRMVNSRWGIALKAMRGDEIAAEVVGVNLLKYKMEVFLVSAIYASIAGSLFAHYIRGVNPPLFTFTLLLMVALALFFGGIGTIWGALIGAVLIQTLPECITALAQVWPRARDTREIIYGVIFVGIILLMPKGLFGSAVKIFAKERRKTQP